MVSVIDSRPLLVQRGARPAQKAVQVIAARYARSTSNRDCRAIFAHLDEGDEEVGHAVAQLLHVGVLVGRALVAVDGDALVHDLAVAGPSPCLTTP